MVATDVTVRRMPNPDGDTLSHKIVKGTLVGCIWLACSSEGDAAPQSDLRRIGSYHSLHDGQALRMMVMSLEYRTGKQLRSNNKTGLWQHTSQTTVLRPTETRVSPNAHAAAVPDLKALESASHSCTTDRHRSDRVAPTISALDHEDLLHIDATRMKDLNVSIRYLLAYQGVPQGGLL